MSGEKEETTNAESFAASSSNKCAICQCKKCQERFDYLIKRLDKLKNTIEEFAANMDVIPSKKIA